MVSCWRKARFSSASCRWSPKRKGKSRSKWSRRVIIERGLLPDQGRQINRLRGGWGFGEGQEAHVTEFAPGLHARAGVKVDTSAYERFTGRWSRLFVPSVIAAAGVRSGGMVLDISTGTGEAAVALLPVIGRSGAVVGVDISPEMVHSAVRRVNDTRFLPIAADGQELPFRNGSFDAVVCQLGLQFFPEPARGLSEFRRVLRPGGKAAVCVISYPDRAPIWGFLAEAIARCLPEMRDVVLTSFALADDKKMRDFL